MDVVIYHNPACGASRNTLALIRNPGVEPHVIDYLKRPPARPMVAERARRTGIGVRGLLREEGTPCPELGLGGPSLSDDHLLEHFRINPARIQSL